MSSAHSRGSLEGRDIIREGGVGGEVGVHQASFFSVLRSGEGRLGCEDPNHHFFSSKIHESHESVNHPYHDFIHSFATQ